MIRRKTAHLKLNRTPVFTPKSQPALQQNECVKPSKNSPTSCETSQKKVIGKKELERADPSLLFQAIVACVGLEKAKGIWQHYQDIVLFKENMERYAEGY